MSDSFDFEHDVLDRSHIVPVLVELSAPSCGPCIWMERTLIEVVREMRGLVEFVSLSTIDHNNLVDLYQIKSNPATILFIKGVAVARLKGALPAMVVRQWISDYISSEE